MGQVSLALIVLISAAVPGCLGDGRDDGTDQANVQSLPPEHSGELGRPGRIAGAVTDAALQPIAGARVALLEHNRTAVTTRADGAYVLSGLPPASHLVRIEADGFVGQTYLVDVFRDQTTILDVVLPRVPVERPFHETHELEGFMACRAAAAQGEGEPRGVACPLPDENDRSSFELAVGPAPQRILLELAWEASSELSAEMEVEIGTAMLGAQDATLGMGHGPSVLRIEVPGSAMDRSFPEGGVVRLDVAVHPSAGDHEGATFGAAFQQPFTLLVTVFYVDAGPGDFSALAGSA